MNARRSGSRPLIFGEVLLDVFDDGREVAGGAPFNVAWNAKGLGCDPIFVGRVGADERGERIRDLMATWNLGTDGLQDDLAHATGVVRATVEAGSPRYEIVSDRAWDFVEPARAAATARWHEVSLLVHGTLALRSERTRAAFERVRDAVEAPVFYDVNLREPWTPLDRVRQLLAQADVVKLNDDELAAVTGSRCADFDACGDAARRLRVENGLRSVWVTRGANGALVVGEEGILVAESSDPPRVVDTIGAGDAFSAVVVIGLLEGWPVRTTLHRANDFAASVCTISGATTEEEEPYRSHRERWEQEEGTTDATT